jgi:hypothetical protein
MPGPRPKGYRLGHISKAQREQLTNSPTSSRQSASPPIRTARFIPVTIIPKASSRWLPQVQAWFNSIEPSPQSALFQASDWATAVAAAEVYDVGLRNHNARCMANFVALSKRLGMTIGDRVQASIATQHAEADDATDDIVQSWHMRLRVVRNEQPER